MLARSLCVLRRRPWDPSSDFRKLISQAAANGSSCINDSVSRKRVFGIAAHIDAGKTTTSEAILHASGSLRRSKMGRVDRGDTALDYLPAERERGITIQSASATFTWRDHRIFLVDSPGHLDFTFEVERALRVMDSVVVVVDAVAGVQPQTETVWRQADRAKLPRLLLVNKMDRDGTRLAEVINEVELHFGVRAPLLYYPLHDTNGVFTGVMDLVNADVSESTDPEISAAREKLVEAVAEFDDEIMSSFLEERPISRTMLREAIRSACTRGDIVPVLCAAALKDIGVREVMDSVVDYLPSPFERKAVTGMTEKGTMQVENDPSGPFIAQAFKVSHDGHRGRLVHFRAFSGLLNNRKHPIWNVNKQKKERATKWLHMLADEVYEKEAIECGDVFSMAGLQHTETGDTISCTTPESPAVNFVLEGMDVPTAVCSVAIETDTPSAQRQLDDFLNLRLAEDPSLRLTVDEQTGETLLSGVGELHLESITDRAKTELPIEVHVSRPRVAYRETIASSIHHKESYDAQIGTAHLVARLGIELQPAEDNCATSTVSVAGDEWTKSQREAIHSGAIAGLSRGAQCGLQTQGIKATVGAIESDTLAASYSEAALRACGSQAARTALQRAQPTVVEPVMHVEVDVPEMYQKDIMNELSHPIECRGRVESCDPLQWGSDSNEYVRIVAAVPLDGMIGWARKMRCLCKGRGSFSMELSRYEPVPSTVLKKMKMS